MKKRSRAVIALSGVAVISSLAFSAQARAVTPDYEPVWYGAVEQVGCADNQSNVAVTGNPIVYQGGSSCNTLTGAQWTAVDSPITGAGFELVSKNHTGGDWCMDNRGSTTNGTQYVIKPCNGSLSQAFLPLYCYGEDVLGQLMGDVMWLSGNNTSNGTAIVVHYGVASSYRAEQEWASFSDGTSDYPPGAPCSSFVPVT